MAPIAKPKFQLQRTYLREWRRQKDLSQEAAAKELNISRGLLSQLENAKTPYTQRLLEQAASLYGCTTTEILSGPHRPIDIDLFYRIIIAVEENRLSKKVTARQKATAIIELYKTSSVKNDIAPGPSEVEYLLQLICK